MSTDTTEGKPIEVAEEKPVLFGDTIDFNNLFRVAGKKELYTPASQLNKSGMVGMRSFIEHKTITVHKMRLQCLGHYEFTTANNEKIKMAEVFNNLNQHSDEFLKSLNDTPELLNIMVPEYDPYLFKPYHALKVLAWYFEIKNKIEA